MNSGKTSPHEVSDRHPNATIARTLGKLSLVAVTLVIVVIALLLSLAVLWRATATSTFLSGVFYGWPSSRMILIAGVANLVAVASVSGIRRVLK